MMLLAFAIVIFDDQMGKYYIEVVHDSFDENSYYQSERKWDTEEDAIDHYRGLGIKIVVPDLLSSV